MAGWITAPAGSPLRRLLATAGVVLVLAACSAGTAGHHHATQPAAKQVAAIVNAMTVNKAELVCLDVHATGQPGTGLTYRRVLSAAVSFGAPRADAPAVVRYIVGHACPQYAHLLPAGQS
jgi:hypothetical protein